MVRVRFKGGVLSIHSSGLRNLLEKILQDLQVNAGPESRKHNTQGLCDTLRGGMRSDEVEVGTMKMKTYLLKADDESRVELQTEMSFWRGKFRSR